jgi:hypothetical protein
MRREKHADPKATRPAKRRALTRRGWQAVQIFRQTRRTEEAFYLRFQLLGRRDRRLLRTCWDLPDDWTLYRRLCRFWGIGRRISVADRAEQRAWEGDEAQMRFPFAVDEAA